MEDLCNFFMALESSFVPYFSYSKLGFYFHCFLLDSTVWHEYHIYAFQPLCRKSCLWLLHTATLPHSGSLLSTGKSWGVIIPGYWGHVKEWIWKRIVPGSLDYHILLLPHIITTITTYLCMSNSRVGVS